MKKLFIILILFLSTLASSQNVSEVVLNTQFYYQQIDESNHKFTFHTTFSIGYAENCPPITNTEISFEQDTMYVKNFYDIRGAWQQSGCTRTNEMFYNNVIPEGVNYIKLSTNVITYSIVPEDSLIINDVHYQIFELNSLSTRTIDINSKINIYPNPIIDKINIIGDVDINKYQIFNSIGQIVETEQMNQNHIINIEHLTKGIYHLILFTDNNKKKQFKIIKQ